MSLEIFHALSRNLVPTAMSFGAMTSACEKAGVWWEAIFLVVPCGNIFRDGLGAGKRRSLGLITCNANVEGILLGFGVAFA